MRFLVIFVALILSGCELIPAMQVEADEPVAFSRQQKYQCDSGRNIIISYSQTGDSAMLLYDGQTQVLPKVSADAGMRFQGGQWAWSSQDDKGALFHQDISPPKERCTRIDERTGKAQTLVSGRIEVPSALPSFNRAVLDLRLYKYEPFATDKRAEMVDWVQSEAISHQQGSTTRRPFQIGTQEPRDSQMGYYLTLYVLEDGHRTHMGLCQHNPQGLCKVLTQDQPSEVQAIFKPLGQ